MSPFSLFGAQAEFLETTNDAEMTFVADLEKRRTGIFDLCIPFSSKKLGFSRCYRYKDIKICFLRSLVKHTV